MMLHTLITPFDRFLANLLVWAQDSWQVGAVLAAALVTAIGFRILYKSRSRARARVPHYRRHP